MEGYKFPKDKYTVEEFLVIFNKDSKELYDDVGKISYEEADKRFSLLYEHCPIGLILDPFGLMSKLENTYPEWNERNKRIFKI